MNIILLGGGLQGLSCGRSLHEKGYVVDVISDELDIRKSKYFRTVISESITNDVYNFKNTLQGETFSIVIPMSDYGVSFLSKNKALLEKDLKILCACPEYDKLAIVENKRRFMSFCKDYDIPHPKTMQLTDESIESCAQNIGFPSLIKPDYSVGARGVTFISNETELKELFPVITNSFGTCTLQEYIDNDKYYYNVMLYRDVKGNFLGHTIIKIIRKYPIHAGSSSLCISVENEELLNICKDCLDKLNWVGMADFDVLQRLDNKEYRIIEINARVPASVRAAAISGVNFPEIIVLDALGHSIPNQHYIPGKSLRYLGIDIMWFLKSSNRFKAKPSWFKFWGRNLYYQDIYANDFSTWWTWLAVGLAKIRRRNKRLR